MISGDSLNVPRLVYVPYFILHINTKSFNSEMTFANVQRNMISISVNKSIDDLIRYKRCTQFARRVSSSEILNSTIISDR